MAPAFADPVMFPDAEIQFWLDAASILLTCRWGSALGIGTVLFVEHNLALTAAATPAPGSGMVPGIYGGIATSKSVGSVSVSYDTNRGTEADAGHWNLTVYGERFIRMARLIGAGPIQLGVPGWATGGCLCGMLNPAAWPSDWGGIGPGWHNNSNSNVPVGKFLPQPQPRFGGVW
jgi:hypothetical protein